jgi:hypothetical protein
MGKVWFFVRRKITDKKPAYIMRILQLERRKMTLYKKKTLTEIGKGLFI